MDNNETLYIIFAIILVVVLIWIFSTRTIENFPLKGFWVGDPSFCKNAELTAFVLYIGENTSYLSESREVYFIAANEQGIFLNNPAVLNLSGIHIRPTVCHEKNYNVNIEWLVPLDQEDTFPSKCKLAYYPKHGKLVFYEGDTVLAILWRDNIMSAADSNTTPDTITIEKIEDGEEL